MTEKKAHKTMNNQEIVLPILLRKNYKHIPFVLKLKSKFLFYLIITLIAFTFLILMIDIFVSKTSYISVPFYQNILIGEIALILVLIISFFILIKGYYTISAHLTFFFTLTAVWFVIFIDRSSVIARIDTMPFLFAVLSMLPLTLSKRSFLIPVYISVNFILLFVYGFVFFDALFINKSVFFEFIGDITVALVFLSIVIYNIHKINLLALNKAELDIYERKNTEKLLLKSEKKFRHMAELLPQTLFEMDLKGNFLFINKRAFEIFQYTAEDFKKGLNVFQMIDPKEHEKAKSNIKNNFIQKDINNGNKYTALKKTGEKFPVRIYSSAIIENNKPIGLRGIIIDITEQQKAEKKIKESEEKYRVLLENMSEVVLYVDNDDRIKFINKKFTETLSYKPEEVIGKIAYNILNKPEDYEVIINANKKIKESKSGYYELTCISKTGQKIDFLVGGTPLKDELGNVIGSIRTMTNITDRKQAQKELEEHKNNLEQLVKNRTEALEATNEELIITNEELYNQKVELQEALRKLHNTQAKLIESEKMMSLGILTSGVAHEINNPLNYIQGGIFVINEFIKDQVKDPPNKLMEMTEGIQIGVERISKIVDSLNRFSRQNDSLFESCDIDAIIYNCLIILQNEMKHKIEINYVSKNKPLMVQGNEGKLHQVFLNIITNAKQAIVDKGTINIVTKISGDKASITISDTGVGIDKKNLSNILNPFFTTKEPGVGTGLGLSISYNIIEQHKGNIQFDSELNKGTKVKIELPLYIK